MDTIRRRDRDENRFQHECDLSRERKAQWELGFEELMKSQKWDWWSTWTFRFESGLWPTRRTFETFMRQLGPGVTYLYVIERNRMRDGHHVHAVISGVKGRLRKEVGMAWSEKYGIHHIRVFNKKKSLQCGGYLSKYLMKSMSHWDMITNGAECARALLPAKDRFKHMTVRRGPNKGAVVLYRGDVSNPAMWKVLQGPDEPGKEKLRRGMKYRKPGGFRDLVAPSKIHAVGFGSDCTIPKGVA